MADLSYSQSLNPINTYDFLPPVNRWAAVGGWFLLLSIGGAISASFVVTYSTTVKAPAFIRPAGEPRLVQSPVAGTVVNMPVTDNMPVQKGDIIAQLETASLETQAAQLSVSLTQGNNRLKQLDAQLMALDQQLAAETLQSQREVAAFSADYEQTLRENENRSITAQSAVQEAQARLALAEREVMSFRQLVASGAASRLQLSERESALVAAEAQLMSLTAALNPSQGNVQAAKARIEQAQASGAAAQARLQQTKQQLLQQQLEIKEQLQATQQELTQVGLTMENAVVRSPVSGTIHEFSLRNVGQVVGSGETLAKVIPADAPIVIQALIPTEQINKVEVGLPAQLRLSACPYSEFGTATGLVQEISPDVVTSAASGSVGGSASSISANQNGAFYTVLVEAESRELQSKQGNTCRLLPGTEGEITIISRKETVISFLLRKASLVINL
ncbi:MAG: HlyD family efflux transporter periplasmic adaptor subunit [Cyanobacteria bacterium P01_D01_bin.105]